MMLNQYSFYVSKLLCLQFWFQDGSVHIYDLQTGQWVSSFEAALGTEVLHSSQCLWLYFISILALI